MKRTDACTCAAQASAFEHLVSSQNMVLTRNASVLVRPEQKVRHMVLDATGKRMAWVEGSTQVFIAELKAGRQAEVKANINHSHHITCLVEFEGRWLVGDDVDGVSVHTEDGILIRHTALDGGLSQCLPMEGGLVGITGMGQFVLMDADGLVQPIAPEEALEDCLQLVVHGSTAYVATQSGDVVAIEGGHLVWRRPKRGEFGERITAIGTTSGGGLFLTREGHALVGGEEEAIEFELWFNHELVVRHDQRMRLLTSCPTQIGAILGYDDGSVVSMDEQGQFEPRFNTNHPVFQCLEVGPHILASSWFYLFGMTEGTAWKVEHQGMPTLLALNATSNTLLFAGDDQNDYTAPEPIGVVDLSDALVEVDEAELGLWFEHSEAPPAMTAEALYNDHDDVLEYLTEEERASYSGESFQTPSHLHLLDAMGGVEDAETPFKQVAPEHGLQGHSDEDLSLALGGMEDLTLLADDDLLTLLQADEDEIHRPHAIAGEDQQVLAENDGTAIVHLDGRGTVDPHGWIVRWSWHNERGEELSTSNRLKVRLPIGTHRFELRVVDREGSWTTDSLAVEVIQSPTS
jgi:hypothetical protein